ncbi:MAG: DMT family transporter [Chitinophagales bacterium]
MKDHLHLHFIVLIYGFTGILGKLISLPSADLVFYRMLLAAIGMFVFVVWKKKQMRLSGKVLAKVFGVGIIVAVHWITFFGAIKASNVSVALGCMASVTLFTSFLEPLFDKVRIAVSEVVLGLVIIVGLYVITQFAFDYWWGIVLALISAFLAALFGVMNKQLVRKYDASVVSMYEMIAGFVFIAFYFIFTQNISVLPHEIPSIDAFYLLILALICTTYAFIAMNYLLERLSAYTLALVINMEPVYAIILAYWIFGDSERMHIGFYIGALIIIASIAVYPLIKKKEVKEVKNAN